MSKFIPTAEGGAVNRDHVTTILPPYLADDEMVVEVRFANGDYALIGPFKHEWGAWDFILNGSLVYLDTSRRDAKVEAARQKVIESERREAETVYGDEYS